MNILCPTDFSKDSMKALEYAVYMSNHLDATLHIIHVYNYLPHSSAVDYIKSKIKEQAQNNMNTLLTGISELIVSDQTPVNSLILGNPVKEILNYSVKQNIDLVVMGSQGINSVKSILFGSNTKMITSESKIPILIVPQKPVKDLSTHQMVLALDNKELYEYRGFELLKEISKRFGQVVDILHISKKENIDDLPFDPFISNFLSGILGKASILEGDEITKSLNNYVISHNAGLLIMIRRTHSTLRNLFIKDNTVNEIEQLIIPLLVIPDVT